MARKRSTERQRNDRLDLLEDFLEVYEQIKDGARLRDVRTRRVKTYQQAWKTLQGVDGLFGSGLFSKDERSGIWTPTAKGKGVYDGIRRMMSIYRALGSRQSATVTIAAIDAAANIWIPEALGKKDSLGDINVEVTVGEWWDVIDKVRNGYADFGIATHQEVDASVELTPLLDRDHLAAVHADHDLAKKGTPIDLKRDLSGQRIICLRSGLAYLAVQHDLRQMEVQAKFILVETVSQILAWVLRGAGVGFVPEEIRELKEVYPSLKYRELDPKLVRTKDAIYTPKDRPLSESAETVYKAILKRWNLEEYKRITRK